MPLRPWRRNKILVDSVPPLPRHYNTLYQGRRLVFSKVSLCYFDMACRSGNYTPAPPSFWPSTSSATVVLELHINPVGAWLRLMSRLNIFVGSNDQRLTAVNARWLHRRLWKTRTKDVEWSMQQRTGQQSASIINFSNAEITRRLIKPFSPRPFHYSPAVKFVNLKNQLGDHDRSSRGAASAAAKLGARPVPSASTRWKSCTIRYTTICRLWQWCWLKHTS